MIRSRRDLCDFALGLLAAIAVITLAIISLRCGGGGGHADPPMPAKWSASIILPASQQAVRATWERGVAKIPPIMERYGAKRQAIRLTLGADLVQSDGITSACVWSHRLPYQMTVDFRAVSADPTPACHRHGAASKARAFEKPAWELTHVAAVQAGDIPVVGCGEGGKCPEKPWPAKWVAMNAELAAIGLDADVPAF